MLILRMARAWVPRGAADAFETRLASPPADFNPLIGPARTLQAKILGIGPVPIQPRRLRPSLLPEYDYGEDESRFQGAEIFTDGHALYVVRLLAAGGDRRARLEPAREEAEKGPRLLLSYIGPDVNPENLQRLTDFLNTAFEVELAPYQFTSRRFEELKQDGRESPPSPSPEELSRAVVLRDRHVRTLATAIKASGGLLVRDLPKQVPEDARSRVDEMRKALLESELIESEIVVVCTKTQAQVARAPSRGTLEEVARSGLKCSCGRPIAEERIEEALTITPAGRDQLEKSRWLTTLVLAELDSVGVPRDRTLIGVQEGGDELDLVAELSGELVFFELKDKEFNLGNAYSFGAKIGLVQPEHAVIVTTAAVGNDAKDHFQRARTASRTSIRTAPWREVRLGEIQRGDVRYIEGVDRLSVGIRELATQVYQRDSIRILSEVLQFAALDPYSLVSRISETEGAKTGPESSMAPTGTR